MPYAAAPEKRFRGLDELGHLVNAQVTQVAEALVREGLEVTGAAAEVEAQHRGEPGSGLVRPYPLPFR